MIPVSRNLTLYQGDSYSFTFRLRERSSQGDPGNYVDLTGVEAKAQIRQSESSSGVAAEFTATIPDQTVAEDTGRVILSLIPAETAALNLTNSAGVWDVQLTFPDGTIKTYLRGGIKVIKEVTRV